MQWDYCCCCRTCIRWTFGPACIYNLNELVPITSMSYPLLFFLSFCFISSFFLSFILILIYSFFIYYILTTTFSPSIPSTPLPMSLLAQIHFSVKKRVCLPGISTKHGIISYNKTRHKPLFQDWKKQASRRKRIPRETQKSQRYLPLLAVPQEH